MVLGAALNISQRVINQSTDTTEDDVRASERTIREMHLLPFQIAVRYPDPWAFMTSYNKID